MFKLFKNLNTSKPLNSLQTTSYLRTFSSLQTTNLTPSFHILKKSQNSQKNNSNSNSNYSTNFSSIRNSLNLLLGCGIMAMTGTKDEDDNVVPYLLEGLHILQNRGYDSAGLATIDKNSSQIKCTKHASKGSTCDSLDLLKKEAPENHTNDICGIAHTRWATHGAKTDRNAHPHLDYKNRIALIHNGTIENCQEIKNRLIEYGITFESETDTEVISNLIGYYLDKGYNEEDSLSLALSELDGSWGLCMLSKDRPNEIFAARYGSPLLIGLGKNKNFIASEHTAFQRYTNEYIPLDDGEICVVGPDYISLDINRKEKLKDVEKIELSPDPYEHWTLKEIMEQPEAVSRALNFGGRLTFDKRVKLGGLDDNSDILLKVKHMIITGCGTSLHAGQFGKRIMQYLGTFDTIDVIDSGELILNNIPSHVDEKTIGMLAVSQSGETKDVLNALNIAENRNIPRFSLVNATSSAIARKTGMGVYVKAGREHGVASTKAFITQITCLCLIAAWFAQNIEHSDAQRRKLLIEQLHKLGIFTGMTIRHTQKVAQRYANSILDNLNNSNDNHLFVLGKGFAEPIANEGALKIKEISYIHAEGYSGSALKHGPFALINQGTPIIMIILDDQNKKTMITNAHEIESRGGNILYITDNIDLLEGLKHKNQNILIPNLGPLTALLATIPLQLIAYYLSVNKGINPDKPKNLAKAVTVD